MSKRKFDELDRESPITKINFTVKRRSNPSEQLADLHIAIAKSKADVQHLPQSIQACYHFWLSQKGKNPAEAENTVMAEQVDIFFNAVCDRYLLDQCYADQKKTIQQNGYFRKYVRDKAMDQQIPELILRLIDYFELLSKRTPEEMEIALSFLQQTDLACVDGSIGQLEDQIQKLCITTQDKILFNASNKIKQDKILENITHVVQGDQRHLLPYFNYIYDGIVSKDQHGLRGFLYIPLKTIFRYIQNFDLDLTNEIANQQESLINETISLMNEAIANNNGIAKTWNPILQVESWLNRNGLLEPFMQVIGKSISNIFEYDESYNLTAVKTDLLKAALQIAFPDIVLDGTVTMVENKEYLIQDIFDKDNPQKIADAILSKDKNKQLEAVRALWCLASLSVGGDPCQFFRAISKIVKQDNPALGNQPWDAVAKDAQAVILRIADNNSNEIKWRSNEIAFRVNSIASRDEDLVIIAKAINYEGLNASEALVLRMPDEYLDMLKQETTSKAEGEENISDNIQSFISQITSKQHSASAKYLIFYHHRSSEILSIFQYLMTYAKKQEERSFFKNTIEKTFYDACLLNNLELVSQIMQYNISLNLNQTNQNNKTPFYIACEKGHIELVKLMLNSEKEIDFNKVDTNGFTPFFAACFEGRLEVVKLLIADNRVDINQPNKYNQTPFYIACEKGHIEIIKLMLASEKEIDFNKADSYNKTPFYAACSQGRLEVVKLLIADNRVDINQPDKYNQTPFFAACFVGCKEIVELMLNSNKLINFNNANDDGQTPFYIACEKGHIEIIKLIFSSKKEIDFNVSDQNDQTAFYIACENGHKEIVELMLTNNKIDFDKADANRCTPFFAACFKGHIEIVELMLNSKKEIDYNWSDQDDQTAFYIACEKGHIEIIKLMLASEKEIDYNKVDTNGCTPFFAACFEGHIEIIKLMLASEKGIDFNKADSYNKMPFYAACSQEHIEVVKLLIADNRVNINQPDKLLEQTPFYIACEKGHIELVKLILNSKKEIDYNWSDQDDQTAFYIACEKGHIEIIKLMLASEKKIDFDKRNKDKHSPFHIACTKRRLEIVGLMLNSEKKIDYDRDWSGKTPFYTACTNGCLELVQLMLDSKKEIDFNKADPKGQTPFFMACAKNYQDIVRAMLKNNKIDFDKADKLGRTPLVIAETNNAREVALMVKYRNANKTQIANPSQDGINDGDIKGKDSKKQGKDK